MSGAAVITIDGPAAAGKGTVARQTAAALNFHYLDSGKIYRAVAWALLQRGESVEAEAALLAVADDLASAPPPRLTQLLAAPQLIESRVSEAASRLSVNAVLRRRLLGVQRAMRRPPGLVADGRDMGSVVFPDAAVKIFLTASPAARARRRFDELGGRGINATIMDVGADMRKRDWRDETRANSSLKPPDGSVYIDSTHMSPDVVVQIILKQFYAANGG